MGVQDRDYMRADPRPDPPKNQSNSKTTSSSESQPPDQSSQKAGGGPGAILGLVFGLMALLGGVIWTALSGFFYLASIQTEASMVVIQSQTDEKREPSQYEFTTGTSQEKIRGKSLRGEEGRKIGDKIPIRYLPALPAWNSEDQAIAILGGPLALAGLGFIGVLFSAGRRRAAHALDPDVEEGLAEREADHPSAKISSRDQIPSGNEPPTT